MTTGANDLNSISGVEVVVDAVLKRPPYAEIVRLQDSVSRKHGVTTNELSELLTQTGFAVESIQVRTATWPYKTAEEIFRFAQASSFGNALNHIPESVRERAKWDIAAEFKKHEIDGKLAFDRHNIFAVAQNRSKA